MNLFCEKSVQILLLKSFSAHISVQLISTNKCEAMKLATVHWWCVFWNQGKEGCRWGHVVDGYLCASKWVSIFLSLHPRLIGWLHCFKDWMVHEPGTFPESSDFYLHLSTHALVYTHSPLPTCRLVGLICYHLVVKLHYGKEGVKVEKIPTPSLMNSSHILKGLSVWLLRLTNLL